MTNLKNPFRLMDMEILCSDVREFWVNIGGVLSNNVFLTNWPAGGAVRGPSEKCWTEVHLRHLGTVRVKCGCDRGNGAGD